MKTIRKISIFALAMWLALSVPVTALAVDRPPLPPRFVAPTDGRQPRWGSNPTQSTPAQRPTLQWNIGHGDTDWNPGERPGKPLSITYQRLQEILVNETRQVQIPITVVLPVENWHIAERETRTTITNFNVSGPLCSSRGTMVGGSWVFSPFRPAIPAVPGRPAVAPVFGIRNGRRVQISPGRPAVAPIPGVPARAAFWSISGGTPVRSLYRDSAGTTYTFAHISTTGGAQPVATVRVTRTVVTTALTGNEHGKWTTRWTAASAASSRGSSTVTTPNQAITQHFISRREVNALTGQLIRSAERFQGPFATAPTLPPNVTLPGNVVTEFQLIRTDTRPERTVEVFTTRPQTPATPAVATEHARVLAIVQRAQRDFRLPNRYRLVQERSTDGGRTWREIARQTNTHATLREAQAAIPLPNPQRTAGPARWFIREMRHFGTNVNADPVATGQQEGPFATEAAARAAAAARAPRIEERLHGPVRTTFFAMGEQFQTTGGHWARDFSNIDPHARVQRGTRDNNNQEVITQDVRTTIGTSLFNRRAEPAHASFLDNLWPQPLFAGSRLTVTIDNLRFVLVPRTPSSPPVGRFGNGVFETQRIPGNPIFSVQRNAGSGGHAARMDVWAIWPVANRAMIHDAFTWEPYATSAASPIMTRWRTAPVEQPRPPTEIRSHTETRPTLRHEFGRSQASLSIPSGTRVLTWEPVQRNYTRTEQTFRTENRIVQVSRPEEVTVTSEVRVGSRLVR